MKQNNQDFEKYAICKEFNLNVNPVFQRSFEGDMNSHGCPPAQLKVLDFGCGDGKLFPYYIKNGLPDQNIHGVEASKIRIERCNKLGWKNALYKDVEDKLPYEDNSFDIVCMMEVIEHIPFSKVDFNFKEITRVLRKDGTLFITTPNYPIKRFYDLYEAFHNKKWTRLKDDPTHVAHYSHKLLKKILDKYSLQLEFIMYKKGFLYNYFKNNFFMHKILVKCKKYSKQNT
ncbi:MAG: hypothetical protein ACD_22C00170G0007 [uncultured bacterium]|nr:MAG: hypothetical protein ACD_22C00170G0007 [uncultured bacterium]